MTTTEPTSASLFGLEGAETMDDDIGATYERWLDDLFDDDDKSGSLKIEEWSSRPLGESLPSAERILEWVADMCGDDCWDDDALEAVQRGSGRPEVVAACEAFRAEFASKITGWRMADRLIATHLITWDDAGEPLVDGEPLYRPATVTP